MGDKNKYIEMTESMIDLVKSTFLNGIDTKTVDGIYSSHTVVGGGVTYIYENRKVVFLISRYNSGITLTIDDDARSYTILRWVLKNIYGFEDNILPYSWDEFENINRFERNKLGFFEFNKNGINIDIVKGDVSQC